MNYAESLEFLAGLHRFGLKFGLETSHALAARAGHPESRLAFIHVAGTNGKGSTCAFLESILRQSGRRVGLYTSPHLVSFRERIQLDRVPIPEDDVARLLTRMRPWLECYPAEEHPTFFELVTVLALMWFAEQGCDVVIWETGMGGRLDATNIVTPLATVITNIGWDHMAWLGSTLGAIAAEKAGILKPGVPTFTATEDAEAWAVIAAQAESVGAPLARITRDGPEADVAAKAGLPLRGEHQVLNAALAIAVVRALAPRFPVSEQDLQQGLRAARWDGRFQVRRSAGGGTVVLDGAHNASAFAVLQRALAAEFPGQRYVLVLGLLADKDAVSAVDLLGPGAARVVLVPVASSRGGDPQALAALFHTHFPGLAVSHAAGVASALESLAHEPLVVVAGSLYLVGEVLGLWQGPSDAERALNDWGPTR